jgi:hypothetical protein
LLNIFYKFKSEFNTSLSIGSIYLDPLVEIASDLLLDLLAKDPIKDAVVNNTKRKTVVQRSYNDLKMIVTVYNIKTIVELLYN